MIDLMPNYIYKNRIKNKIYMSDNIAWK